MLEDKTDFDILGMGSYTFDTLILTSQSAIQNSGLPKDYPLTIDSHIGDGFESSHGNNLGRVHRLLYKEDPTTA